MKIKKIIEKDKNIKKPVKFLITILLCMVIITCISGCSLSNLIMESFTREIETPEIPDVEIDDAEIKTIGKGDIEIKKSYDVETEISVMDESLRNPFKPFYVINEETEEKNILKLEKIFSKDGIDYAEINFNDYTYSLKLDDTLSDAYLVQAINVNSVVLLRGDEILTLYLDIPVYD